MILDETNVTLAKLLISVLEHENSIEVVRELLADNLDFDTFQVFKSIDLTNKNYINESDLKEFLKQYRVTFNNYEIKQIIAFYDSNLDGNLNYFE
jgi:Ca2+-binding EF-hand superfamily protein